ncbi:MAG: hypothetical protein NVV73_17775 [Cellvibrionaceae bacterium]|nr:hypothetical protein [Cellvibrionaceae bacterium]
MFFSLNGIDMPLPSLRLYAGEENASVNFNGTTQTTRIEVHNGDLLVSAKNSVGGYNPEISIFNGNISMESSGGDINFHTATLVLENNLDPRRLPNIKLTAAGNIDSNLGNNAGANITLIADSDKNGVGNVIVSEDFSTGGGSFSVSSVSVEMQKITTISSIDSSSAGGNISITVSGDLTLPGIVSGGDLYIDSSQGSVSLGESIAVAGETRINADQNINILKETLFNPNKNVFLNAGNDIYFAASSDIDELGFLELAPSNPGSFVFSAGRNIVVESTLVLGSGDFIASAGTKGNSPSDFPVPGSPVIGAYNGPGIYAKAIDTNGRIIFRSSSFIDSPVLESGSNGSGGFIGYYTNGSVALPYFANSNGNFEVHNYVGAENLISEYQLSDGSTIELPNLVSFESANSGYVSWYTGGSDTTLATSGGDFYIEAKNIQHWGAHALDVALQADTEI